MSEYYSISKMATIAGCDRRTMSARVSHLTPEKETTNYKGFSLKQQFKLWLEEKQKEDEMIIIATVPQILKRFDSRLAIIRGNRLEKCYLSKWRALFRIDRTMLND